MVVRMSSIYCILNGYQIVPLMIDYIYILLLCLPVTIVGFYLIINHYRKKIAFMTHYFHSFKNASNDKINALNRDNKELGAELKSASTKISQLEEEAVELKEKNQILQIRLRHAENIAKPKENDDIIIEYYTQNGKTSN